MSDPLAEILEAAGIPQAKATRTLAERDGHSVVTAAPSIPQVISFTQAEYLRGTRRMVERCNIDLMPWQREILYGWVLPSKPVKLTDITNC